MFGRATITFGIGPHSSYSFLAADTLREFVALTFDLLILVSAVVAIHGGSHIQPLHYV